MTFNGGSFRDPSGRIFHHENRVLRAVYRGGYDSLISFKESGAMYEMIERKWLLPAEFIPNTGLEHLAGDVVQWLEHPRIEYISYPYEWCFSALKAAALLHLEMHISLLEKGFTLADATAYNVQFLGTKPVFIDHLSVVPYVEGSAWTGQRQFGMQFLNPLYLWARKKVAPHAWYRGSLEGIPPEDLEHILGWKDKLSFTVLAHIVGPAAFERRRIEAAISDRVSAEKKLSKPRLIAILKNLHDYIGGLKISNDKSVWDDYAENNSYNSTDRDAKTEFVSAAVRAAAPNMLYDVGCNSGDYSRVALRAGAKNVVGFDFDLNALERAFVRSEAANDAMLPLWLDAVNPSPSQGWACQERVAMQDRAKPDMVLALALIHHLAIAKNVPLDMAVDWLMNLAPNGVIEFPSKSDPMVQQLLRNRLDIFPDYNEENFLKHVRARGRLVKAVKLNDTGRLIVSYDRG